VLVVTTDLVNRGVRVRRTALVGAFVLACGGVVTLSGTSTAVYVPRTLAGTRSASAGAVVDPVFPVDFVTVRWEGEHGSASVRLRHGERWGPGGDCMKTACTPRVST
jgi:hypothetical protein